MVIFRENTETSTPLEWAAGTPDVKKLIAFLQKEMGVKKIRFPNTSGVGIKPISSEGTERLARAAIDYALAQKRKSVTFVHKGNIMKFTEGAFRDWGYELVRREYRNSASPSARAGSSATRREPASRHRQREVSRRLEMMTPEQQGKLAGDRDPPWRRSRPCEASVKSAVIRDSIAASRSSRC